MDEFLKLEYQECLELVKFYDERHNSLIKFAAGVSSGVPSVLLAFHQLAPKTSAAFWPFAAVLAGATTVGLLIVFVALV